MLQTQADKSVRPTACALTTGSTAVRAHAGRSAVYRLSVATNEPADEPADEPAGEPTNEGPGGEPLTGTVRAERAYVRERLRAELGREPTDEELSEWLRQHTEGY